nr:hypothetical protein [uncultured Brevundimonas sp.]
MADILPFTATARAVATQRQPEVVANLLMLLEDEPLFAPVTWSDRDVTGRVFVGVRHAGVTLRLDPEDAYFAARCLIAEQAFVGCVEVAARLRSAADAAGADVIQLHAARALEPRERRVRPLPASVARAVAAFLARTRRITPRIVH